MRHPSEAIPRPCAARLAAALTSALVLALPGAGARADPPAPGASGIELRGRAGDVAPVRWSVLDASGAVVASVDAKWGTTAVPPGRYSLSVLPRGNDAVEVRWGEVAVEEGQVAKVELRSGIEVVGRAEREPALESWDVTDKASGKQVAHTWRRWGFTPLPPGAYALRLRPQGTDALEVPWGDIAVADGQVARTEIRTGVEVVGRAGAKDEPPEGWDLVAETPGAPGAPGTPGTTIAHVVRRWGFTPVPPGAYELRSLARGDDVSGTSWGRVAVEEGKATRVSLDSGIEVVGRDASEAPLERWTVRDRAGKAVASVRRRWGFLALPAGTYSMRILPVGGEAVETAWKNVEVSSGAVKTVALDSGIDLQPSEGEPPPARWSVLDASGNEAVARVAKRWGFTPLPPGSYVVEKPPMRWSVRVEDGQVVVAKPPDLATRLARAIGAGKKSEKERDPEAWRRLEVEVEAAIRRAGAWLKVHPIIEKMRAEGTADYATLGALALVHAGELERDPQLARRCRDYLTRRALNAGHATYATALTAMALHDMGAIRNRARILECAAWLVENQGAGDARKGWGYGDVVPGFEKPKPADDRPVAPREKAVTRKGAIAKQNPAWDNSNVQFAVLGLHAAAQSRLGIPRESWERVEQHFREVRTQSEGWAYQAGGGTPTGSMTCAGVASLLVARHHLGAASPALDSQVVGGIEWLDRLFTVEENPGSRADHYYFLYGLERVGVLAGTEFLGEHEWYPLGARYLLREQHGDGSWKAQKDPPTGNAPEYLDTCYAILFLRRATLPLETSAPALISVASNDGALRRELSPSVELILDASGSMKDPVDGRPKIEIAREVVREAIAGLTADIQVGLRLYGHRGIWIDRTTDPRAPPRDLNDPRVKEDTQLVVPIGPLDDARRATIERWIAAAQPVGWTPMVHSLLEARKDFPSGGRGAKTVVLVSDGEETGGGRLEDVAAAYRGTGIEVRIHVVGFDIAGTEAERQMKEIARIGGGRFFSARNARELSAALRSVVPSLGFEVLASDGAVVVRGRLNSDPLEVKAGSYRVRLVGIESEPVAVTLEDGDEAALSVDDAGRLVAPRR